MPGRLSTVQRQTLVSAGRSGGMFVRGVDPATGLALEKLRLGNYVKHPRKVFYLNTRGLRLVSSVDNGTSWVDIEKEYVP